MKDNNAWELSIYVSDTLTVANGLAPDQATHHSRGVIGNAVHRVVTARADEIQQQWNRTLQTLMGLSSTIAQQAGDWTIDEIEVGFTLSAKGELLFIAEAGAEASIKFTLKPKA